ncbi:MAG TPA: diguanylate cyclase [Acidimicrobiales bacterium]|jgi:diguanylate cyclase (GGDEF)-like protein|nr:diguanylate cyclase [Acidimicrobiales bacterium]
MRILVADDDPTSRLLLKAMVTKLGHECVVAEDGSSAWDVLASGGIDVLLTDWMMPGVDGPELCRRVRNDVGGGYIYIVLTTGLDNPEDVLEGMSAGADDYLTKPVDRFAVQTRLVAAERVTELHHELAHTQEQLERANFELLEQSLTDQLTGLGNRRRMDEDLARVHARALRVGRTYGIAIFDIDYFKRYNDHYGHVAGDGALRDVASCIDLIVRAGECAYRYGGEEFLVLMPDCGLGDVVPKAADRIRQSVLLAAIPHEARPAEPHVVTVSGGVSCWIPGSQLSARQVLEEADQALYAAKTAGRNRISAAPSGAGEALRAIGAVEGPDAGRPLEVSGSASAARA